MPIRVILADDHLVVRNGLRRLLEAEGFQVAAEAADGREAVRIGTEVAAEVAILDLSMPRLNGLDAARELKKHLPAIRVILLTRHDEPQYVIAALRSGVDGYVLKSRAASDLGEAIRQVLVGDTYLSPDLPRPAVERPPPVRR